VFAAAHRLDGGEYALKVIKPRSVSEEWRNNWLQVGRWRGWRGPSRRAGRLAGSQLTGGRLAAS
jgi:hypothetical protein